jgi:protein-tyrosine phosphatase
MWLLQRHPVETERKRGNNKTKEFIRSQNGYRCLQGLTLTVIVFSAFSTAKIRYTNEIVTFSMRSLDIVEPYLAANEFTKLRSHFHQVRSTEEFMVFYNEISFKAKENSLKLPKFSPL